MKSSSAKNAFLVVGSLLGWFAIIFQLVLMIQNRQVPVPEILIRFFTFFTILTNILVAICFSTLWLKRNDANTTGFFTASRQTAIAVYIVVVGIVYNAILRFMWEPTGLQRVVDEMLHLIIPLFYLIYWLLFLNKQQLVWKDALGWLLYPFVYLVVILVRGGMATTPYYPYPFVNVSELGYEKVGINCLGMLLLFLLLSFAFIAIGRFSKQKAISQNISIE